MFFTFFVDSLCWAIVFPIFAPYFLNPETPLFSSATSDATRTAILGFFLMAFSLGQFMGAPIIGEFADRHGRRKTLLTTIACTFLGLALTAWSMSTYSLSFLFISRFMTGLFASNGSVCLAAVSDLSETIEIKSKNFGRISVLAGIAFIVGAFVGGKLSDPTLNSFFFPELPIWIASAFSASNFILTSLFFKETTHIDESKPFTFFACFQNIKLALQETKLHIFYIIYFLFIFSWTILLQFMPVIMVQRFSFTGSNLGDLALYVGVCWAFGSGHLKDWLLKVFSPSFLLKFCLVISACLTLYVTFPKEIYSLMGILGLSVIFGGVVWPLCTSFISNLAPDKMQGKILSIGQSIQALATTIGPVVGGVAFKWSSHVPFLIAGLATGFAAWLYWSDQRKKIKITRL